MTNLKRYDFGSGVCFPPESPTGGWVLWKDVEPLRLWLRHFVVSHVMRKEFNSAMVSGFRPEQIKEFRDVCLAVLNPGERALLQAQWDASEAKGFCGE